MKIYQDNKEGDRTSPEFEKETQFLIPVGVVLLEIEECSKGKNVLNPRLADYIKEDLDKESKMRYKSVKEV
jgi:hypothetical protein